jgi:hypothetical protein
MYQFLDVEEFSPVRVIATVAKSYLHSPTPKRAINFLGAIYLPATVIWLN